eukprot:2750444-Rhodomonas_salina.1
MNHGDMPPDYTNIDDQLALNYRLHQSLFFVEDSSKKYCDPEIQAAKLDTQLAKRYYFKEWLGDIAALVEKFLRSKEQYDQLNEFKERMNESHDLWEDSSDNVRQRNSRNFNGNEQALTQKLATVMFFLHMRDCKEYVEWVFKILPPKMLTSEVVDGIEDVIRSYKDVSSQVSPAVKAMERDELVAEGLMMPHLLWM